MCWVVTPSANAQEMKTTISAGDNGVELRGPKASTEPDDDGEKKKAYDKRVGGIVWLEATAGPSRFDATRFRSLDIVPAEFAALIPSVVVSGPEFGAALKFRAGSSTIGARFKRADYEPFDMTPSAWISAFSSGRSPMSTRRFGSASTTIRPRAAS